MQSSLRTFLLLLAAAAAAAASLATPMSTATPTAASGSLPARDVVTVAAPLPSTAPQFINETLFVSAVLNSTNFFRSEHNASWAIWNSTLADYADAYLTNDTDCTFAHSGGPYGENIAIGCSDAASCVDLWGNERRSYDFAHPGFQEYTGHFTQLVWKSSTTVGCGRRLCRGAAAGEKNTGWFFACEYWPRGNIIGQFVQEVSRQLNGTTAGSTDSATDDNASTETSAGVITASLVVFALIVSAVAGDIMVVLDDS